MVAQKIEGRWYTTLQITEGKKVFSNNCSSCHGDKWQGLVQDWKETLLDGNTQHHHSMEQHMHGIILENYY